ncbi:porin [Escherichia coli]
MLMLGVTYYFNKNMSTYVDYKSTCWTTTSSLVTLASTLITS